MKKSFFKLFSQYRSNTRDNNGEYQREYSKVDTTPINKNFFAFIWGCLKSSKITLILLMIANLMIALIPSMDSYFTKIIINKAVLIINSGDPAYQSLVITAVLYTLWWEVINIISRAYDYVAYCKLFLKLQSTVISDMFAYAEKHSHRYFQNNLTGNITNKLADMAKSGEDLITILIECLLRRFFIVVFAIVVMYSVHPYFAFVLLIWSAVFLLISSLFFKKSIRLAYEFSESRSAVIGRVSDGVSNISNIRLFARNNYESGFLQKFLDVMVKKDFSQQWFLLKVRWLQGMICTVLIGIMLYLLIDFHLKGLVTVGDFALIMSLSWAIADHIWILIQDIAEFFEKLGVCRQAFSIMSIPHEIVDSPGATVLQATSGAIEFQDVVFDYHGNKAIFNKLSVKIPAWQKVGLVGHSGSGKTTFVNLIVRLFDAGEGKILIDKQDIAKVTQDSLREAITFVPQDPILFHRSIKENIRYGKIDSTDEEVIEAAIKARAHDFIVTKVDGYDEMVGERGMKLSGGQRQRIAIARAILKNSPILILDEATSAMDSVTESIIQESLKDLMQGKTTIVIAHRLSTLLNMDRILVFHQGEIIEDGTHQELLAKKGFYTRLWQSQVGGFLSAEDVSKDIDTDV